MTLARQLHRYLDSQIFLIVQPKQSFLVRSGQAGGLDVRGVGGAGALPAHPHHCRQLRGLPQEPAEDDQGGEGEEEAEGGQDRGDGDPAAVLQQQDDLLPQHKEPR